MKCSQPGLSHLSGAFTISTLVVSVLSCSGGSLPERGTDAANPSAGTKTSEAPSRADASAALAVTIRGIGPIRAGMSVAEASAVLGTALEVPQGVDARGCSYPRWPGGPEGVSIMVEDLQIARVDVRSAATATEEGARVGDTAERVRLLYAGRVTASPHKYTAGQYLTVAPASAADGAFRLIFEVEGGRVTRYRSGKLPQVEYVEGCS